MAAAPHSFTPLMERKNCLLSYFLLSEKLTRQDYPVFVPVLFVIMINPKTDKKRKKSPLTLKFLEAYNLSNGF